MFSSRTTSKSPLTLLVLIAFLVISTLVLVSNYFFRPGLELEIKNQVLSKLYSHNIFNAVIDVKGRDVSLHGVTTDLSVAKKIEAEILNISGVHKLESSLHVQDSVDQQQSNQSD